MVRTQVKSNDAEDVQATWDSMAVSPMQRKSAYPFAIDDTLGTYDPIQTPESTKIETRNLPAKQQKAKDSYPYPAYESWKSVQASKAVDANDLSVKPPSLRRPQLPSPTITEAFFKKDAKIEQSAAAVKATQDFVPSRPKIDESITVTNSDKNVGETQLLRDYLSCLKQQRQQNVDKIEIRSATLLKNQNIAKVLNKKSLELREEQTSNSENQSWLGSMITWTALIGVVISIATVIVSGLGALPGMVGGMAGALLLTTGISQATKFHYDQKSGENQKEQLMNEYETEKTHRNIRSGANQLRDTQNNDITLIRLLKSFIDSWNRTIQAIMQN